MESVKQLVEKITLGDVSKRTNFNSLSGQEVEDFKNDFLKENEADKILYLTKIVEDCPEEELLEGNFKTFFEDDNIKDLLRKCL